MLFVLLVVLCLQELAQEFVLLMDLHHLRMRLAQKLVLFQGEQVLVQLGCLGTLL